MMSWAGVWGDHGARLGGYHRRVGWRCCGLGVGRDGHIGWGGFGVPGCGDVRHSFALGGGSSLALAGLDSRMRGFGGWFDT